MASARAMRTCASRLGIGSRPVTVDDAGEDAASVTFASNAFAATPSASAWCIFATIAIRPSARPSQTWISHSGTVRSRGAPAMRPMSRSSDAMSPGAAIW